MPLCITGIKNALSVEAAPGDRRSGSLIPEHLPPITIVEREQRQQLQEIKDALDAMEGTNVIDV